ncbi:MULTISPECIES: hypothetical protein [Paraburkholderia]|uniref:Fis family transcriptional regulator n=1 Tax=Paraburkholderia podalyriae TaxID=1938811 RepID=A0ABR7PQM2_9BURK|nr:hypothetical protein [Paraburkholderia podalyriae]MBC8748561.1 hypothetical protein [Paraburkholderia podalyriae]
MPSKSRTRKHIQPAMSPLLRALTYSRAAHKPVTKAMLLQCYTALDAFRRGYGSLELFSTLSRQLLVARELCRLGHQPYALADMEAAHAAMMRIVAVEKEESTWLIGDTEYAQLCVALEIIDEQLSTASLGDIAKAEAQMLEGVLRSARKLAIA